MKFVLILTALAATAILVFFLADEDDFDSSLDSSTIPEAVLDPATPSREPRSGDPTEPSPSANSTEASHSADATETPDLNAARAPSSYRPDGSTRDILFRFLNEDDRSLVSEVQVFYLPGEKASRKSGRSLVQKTLAEGERRWPNRFGEIRLPRGRDAGHVVAIARGLWGERVIPEASSGPLDEPVPFFLKPLDVVQARVVDEAGQPVAQAPVSWIRKSEDGYFMRRSTMTTDAEGLVVMPVPEQPERGRSRDEWLRLDALLEDPVEAPIDREALPSDPITLVMPPCSGFSFRVTEPETVPGAHGDLACYLPSEDVGWHAWRQGVFIPIVDGRAEFRFVQRGLAIQAHAALDRDLRYHPLLLDLEAPKETGHLAVVELAFGAKAERPRIVGRLVDAATGEPASRRGFEVRSRIGVQGDRGYHVSRLQCDEEGRFGWILMNDEAHGVTASFQFEVQGNLASRHRKFARVVVEMPQSGAVDVGDVLFREIPVFVAGRVVDAEGKPLQNVGIAPETDASITSVMVTDLDMPLPHGTTTDVEGCFEIRGVDPGLGYRLRVRASDYGRTEVEVKGGEENLLIKIEPRSKIRLLVLAADQKSVSGLGYDLQPHDGALERGVVPDNGLLRLEIDPGSYALSIHDLVDPETPLLAIPELQVEPATTCNLGTRKIDRKLRELRVQVRGLLDLSEDQKAKLEVQALDLVSGAIVGRKLWSDPRDITTLVVSRPEVELRVVLDGRPARARRESGDLTILELP